MRCFANEQRAIQEKLAQLGQVKEGSLSARELAEIITKRRVDWFEANRRQVFQEFGNLPLPEIAYRTIFLSHMGINPKHSRPLWLSEKKLRIESHNFCPYLDACLILQLDTRWVCKVVGEPSIQAVCALIDSALKFSRNYEHIRPYHSFCEEFIEIII